MGMLMTMETMMMVMMRAGVMIVSQVLITVICY